MGIPAAQGVAASGQPPAGDQANAVVQGIFTGIGPSQPFAFRGPMNMAIWGSQNTNLVTTAGSLTATVASVTNLAVGGAINSVNVPAGTTIKTLTGTTITLALPTLTLQGDAAPPAAPSNLLRGLRQTNGLVGATITSLQANIPTGTTVLAVITPAVPATNNSSAVLGVVQLSNPINSLTTTKGPQLYNFAIGAADVLGGTDGNAQFMGSGTTFSGTVEIERSFDGGLTWIICNSGGGASLAVYTAGTDVSLAFGEPEADVLYRFNCIAYTSGTINYRASATGNAAASLSVGALT